MCFFIPCGIPIIAQNRTEVEQVGATKKKDKILTETVQKQFFFDSL